MKLRKNWVTNYKTMAYCTNCGRTHNNKNAQCESCENEIVNRARERVSRADKGEQDRMHNDVNYAHDWVQNVIGWIVELMKIITQVLVTKAVGGCYITTAVVQHKGLSDDCLEMQKLRYFRQQYIHNSNNRILKKELNQYYILGQSIVNWANSRQDSIKIWEFISNYVFEVVELIDKNELTNAYKHFKENTLDLRKNILLSKHLYD
jgi:hypothetical protein